MRSPLRIPALALLLAAAAGGAWAQAAGIYTCTDRSGRRLTSDRPILECVDREQKELNASGTVKRVLPPSLTGPERAALDERDRKLAEERQRQEEDRRMRRALLARYPNAAVHDVERAKALKTASDAVTNGQRRIAQLQDDRQKLAAETEYYKDPAKWPLKLKRQIEQNEQETALQQRYVVTQQEEQTRINARFDDELARLKVLWAQSQGTTAAAAPASETVRR
jgi:hypothetical protein